MLIQSNFSMRLSHIHSKTISYQNQIKYIQNIFIVFFHLDLEPFFEMLFASFFFGIGLHINIYIE